MTDGNLAGLGALGTIIGLVLLFAVFRFLFGGG